MPRKRHDAWSDSPEPSGLPATENKPWSRWPGENAKAFSAFRLYCNIGHTRTLAEVARQMSLSRRRIEQMSAEFDWRERAAQFDTYQAELEQVARDRVRAERAKLWEERRLAAADADWTRAQKLAEHAEIMLSAPLYEKIIEETDPMTGRPVKIVMMPTKWSPSTAATLLKLAAELQAGALVNALGVEDDEAFDPETATPDECRAFLERKGVKALPGPANAEEKPESADESEPAKE